MSDREWDFDDAFNCSDEEFAAICDHLDELDAGGCNCDIKVVRLAEGAWGVVHTNENCHLLRIKAAPYN